MKKLFLMLAVTVVTLSLFSFKSANEGEQKLVSLKNYKVNFENLKKYNNEFYSNVSTGSRVAACKYYCYVRALSALVQFATEFAGNVKADGTDITISEEEAIQFEEMNILSKI